MPRPSRLILATLYTIYALDLAGMAIVLVLFAPLLFDSDLFLSASVSLNKRNVIFGLLLAAYPLTQFFGAPILGEFSDRFGRKRPLFFSVVLTGLSFLLSAFAIAQGSLIWLFISRLMGGLFAGSMTITQASVSELVKEHLRPRYMSIFNIVSGISWTLSPYLGSVLSDSTKISWFSPTLPFLFMAALFFVTGVIVLHKFKDVHKVSRHTIRISLIFKDLIQTAKLPTVAPLLWISLLAVSGWLMYQTFMSPYLVQKYNFSLDWVGKTFTYFSAAWFLGGVLTNQWLLKKFHARSVNVLPMLVASLGVLAYAFFSTSQVIWYASAFANIAESISTSCFFGLFALLAPTNVQGKLFGFWNAGCALSFAVTPVIAGILATYSIDLPFIAASVILFSSFILYGVWYRNHQMVKTRKA